jgi:hypothetical protein
VRPAQSPLTAEWQFQTCASASEGFLRITDLQHALIWRSWLVSPQSFQERAKLWINGDDESLARLRAECRHLAALPIDVAPRDRGSFRLAQPGESEEFDEVGAVGSVAVVNLRAHIGDDGEKLLERRSAADGFVPVTCFTSAAGERANSRPVTPSARTARTTKT